MHPWIQHCVFYCLLMPNYWISLYFKHAFCIGLEAEKVCYTWAIVLNCDLKKTSASIFMSIMHIIVTCDVTLLINQNDNRQSILLLFAYFFKKRIKSKNSSNRWATTLLPRSIPTPLHWSVGLIKKKDEYV